MNAMTWLIIMVGLIIIEIVTVGLTTIWFAGGALAAIAVSSLGGGLAIQLIVFLVVSFALLFFTRPFVMKFINKSHVKTNYEGVIGKIVRITEDVSNYDGTGTAVVNGQEWTARASDDEKKITAGKLAKVINISGVKLIVEEYEEETN
ncbi:MAG: NfeD family protein [Lachnospiraceae bacterium]|nr:NfeD family protein [Lachnospiraceae bacterium]